MGAEQVGWLQTAIIIQTGVTAAAAVIGFLLLWGYRAGKFVSTVDATPAAIANLKSYVDDKINAINARFDRGNKLMSDLSSDVQGLPERMRKEFVTRVEEEARSESSGQFRAATRGELDRLWKIVDPRPRN